jgi:hypothetical protein
MNIKTELISCRNFFNKEEEYLSKCLNSLENVKEINLQCFSTKEMIKNHLKCLKNTINNLSDSCIDNIIKSSKPYKSDKIIKPKVNFDKKIFAHNVDIKKGMILQSPEKDDFPNIKNLEKFPNIKFYYRDPSIFKEGYGLYEFIRGDTTYYVANNKKLYIYDTGKNILEVGFYKKYFQYWK